MSIQNSQYRKRRMAFVCPPKEECEGKTQILSNLKKVFDEVEKKLSVSAKPVMVPCCIPLCDLPCPPCLPKCPWQDTNDKPKEQPKVNPPDVMVCYKVCQKNGRSDEASSNTRDVYRVKQSKSRELRASILYTGCDCEKRDGLQDDCPRTGCHGSPECLTNPPTCGPSEFCDGKHLGKKLYSTSKRSRRNGGDKNGGGRSNFTAKYKCFPAVVSDPVCCCPAAASQ